MQTIMPQQKKKTSSFPDVDEDYLFIDSNESKAVISPSLQV